MLVESAHIEGTRAAELRGDTTPEAIGRRELHIAADVFHAIPPNVYRLTDTIPLASTGRKTEAT